MGEGLELAVRVVHASPGRIRLKVPREALEGAALREAERALTAVNGVRAVRKNPPACSLVISYDPAQVALPVLVEAVARAGVTVRLPDPEPEPPSAGRAGESLVGQSVADFVGRADRRVGQLTGGVADLRTLVPAGLAALAAREVLFGSGVTAVPWYALAWYAFDSFIKLRQPESAEHPDRGAS